MDIFGTMFRGCSYHTIDSKGRIIIPARFRQFLGQDDSQGLMISGMDQCLYAYPFDEWYKLEEKIVSLAVTSEQMRRFRRLFIGGAFECICDKQERILIPPSLRQYADLDKEIVLVGALKHFEIWSRKKWEMEKTNLEDDLKNEEARNEIARLGI